MLRNLIIALVTTLLASCTTMDGEQDASKPTGDQAAAPVETQAPPVVDASAELSTSASALADATLNSEQRPQPIIFRGTDTQLRMPEEAVPVTFLGEDVSLNFEQAPLSEVTHAILGDILKLDYVVDRPIKGQVTLRTRTPIPRGQLLGVLESLLMSNDALLIRGSDGRYLVTGAKGGSRLSPGLSSVAGRTAGFSTIVVPLRHISAGNMAEILQPVADEQAFVRVDNNRNLLMLAGTRDQLDGWLDIVNTFDVDQLQGMSVGMFPLENSDVKEVAEALGGMLDGGEYENLVRIVPFKRLNSILLVTPRSHFLDTLGVWIERLDSAPDSLFEKRLYVYPVQNTAASRLADLLNSIYADEFTSASASRSESGSRDRTSSDRGRQGGVAPGLSMETLGESSGGISINSTDGSQSSSASVQRISQLSSGDTGTFANVRVVADDDNNALMIYSNGKQYEKIKAALEQLDVVATQVIIEASILEVTLTDDLRYGLEWSFKNDVGNDHNGLGILSNTAEGPAALLPGFSYAITNSSMDISAVLNALSEQSLLNVISTPSVMVLDNYTAYIHVGDQIPIIDQQSTSDASDTSRITQSITYKDTGVKLQVTPSVNAGGLVTMDIAQSITDVGPIDSATQQRAFLEREIVSRVAVRSDQSVVLGGLIRENAANTDSGVPILHKLPLVGPIFGTTTKEDTRTELLVIITPRALYSEAELQQVSEEMRAQIRHMELIEAPPL